jgi:hypothetical protein
MRPGAPGDLTTSLHATCSNPEYNVRVEMECSVPQAVCRRFKKEAYKLGDKSKKDKEKGQKQNAAKQKEKMDKKIEKQPKKAS